MATPISQAYKELFNNTKLKNYFKEGSTTKFYREEVPAKILESKSIESSMPFARLNDISNTKSGYASNRATYTDSILQLSIWDKTFSALDTIEELLEEVMPGLGYVEVFSYTTIDPDIEKPYLVKRYSYQK